MTQYAIRLETGTRATRRVTNDDEVELTGINHGRPAGTLRVCEEDWRGPGRRQVDGGRAVIRLRVTAAGRYRRDGLLSRLGGPQRPASVGPPLAASLPAATVRSFCTILVHPMLRCQTF